MKTSICILTRHERTYLEQILDMILKQTEQDFEVNIIDSSGIDKASEKYKIDPRIKTYYIKPTEFGHGKTRNFACEISGGEYITFIVDDAIPLNDKWLESLLKNFKDTNVGGVYSRQIPRDTSSIEERYFYYLNFPKQRITSKSSEKITHKDIFFSNSSSSIRKNLIEKFPFDESLIMCEDQKFAYEILNSGYSTVYEPLSEVIHSHNYNLEQTFQRYFDSSYSLNKILEDKIIAMYLTTLNKFIKEALYITIHNPIKLPYSIVTILTKIIGSGFGAHADKLPLYLKRKMSLHKYYWSNTLK